MSRDLRREAYDLLVKRGHVPARQGDSFECHLCGATGTIQAGIGAVTLTGTISKVRCGGGQ